MIYFDNGATTFPKPKTVLDKLMDCSLNYAANPGRSGHKLALKMDLEIYETREKLCKLINGDNALNMIFTFNGTDSLNLAIQGVVKTGMHIVTTSMEHNSVLRPLHKLEKDKVIDLSIVYADKFGYVNADDVINAVNENTKVIVTTHISNVFGTIIDIKKIGEFCRKNDIIELLI